MKRITLAALIFAAFPVMAQVTVKDPWVRATVSAQKATGAFMQITSTQDARLVEASSPVAGVVEVHEMVLEKDVMKMRAIKGLDLPAGKASGLVEASEILTGIDGISFVRFTERDVVRHRLVQAIITAYERMT